MNFFGKPRKPLHFLIFRKQMPDDQIKIILAVISQNVTLFLLSNV